MHISDSFPQLPLLDKTLSHGTVRAVVSFFNLAGWIAMVVLVFTSVPQIILNFKKRSTKGVSWLMFAMLLFGLSVLFIRSLLTTSDIVLHLNYGLGAFIALLANLQIFYDRIIKTRAGEAQRK